MDREAQTPPQFRGLPDELVEAIVAFLPPTDTFAFALTCKRHNKIAFEPLVWRRHCIDGWRYWEPTRALEEKLSAPLSQTDWRQLYYERWRIDRDALELFNRLLLTQRGRCGRMENVAKYGYDAKDLLLRLRDYTVPDADDVLARTFHANAILGQIHRVTALEKWNRLQRQQMVRLEEALGSYDLFVLAGDKGDLSDMDRELDRLAKAIQERDVGWDDLGTRMKAIRIARYLRSEGLVGNPNADDYHALRNNFLTLALFDPDHTSLPLQSVAIYCAVARRLGVNAKPSNFPAHVHAVIVAPHGETLDGRQTPRSLSSHEQERMHMDPWRSSDQVSESRLIGQLEQMGAPPSQHRHYLEAASVYDTTLRAGRNIMFSIQKARERQPENTESDSYPDMEAAWYGMLWSIMALGEPNNPFATLHRRKQCINFIINHFQTHFREDIGLIESQLVPMFRGQPEYDALLNFIENCRATDQTTKAPLRRSISTSHVKYRIGQIFTHRRYGYQGFVVGWDVKCTAEPDWVQQMRVNDLPGGSEQPFYNVVYDHTLLMRVCYTAVCSSADFEISADDKSLRYVAEENINLIDGPPCKALIKVAGRYFKRWDEEEKAFVSNIKDEYPDD